jgi:hypothetical protein
MALRKPIVLNSGKFQQLQPGDTLADAMGIYTYRPQLTANTTFYVRIDGNDNNDGSANDSAHAFLTIQKAIDTVAALDNGGFNVTIQVGNGTYTQALTLKNYVGSGTVTIQGNTVTPASVVISVTGNNCITADSVTRPWAIQGFIFFTTTSGDCIQSKKYSIVNLGKNAFSTCAGNHISCLQGGQVNITSDYTISDGASQHWNAQGQGSITCTSATITLSGGTKNFSTFAVATLQSLLRVNGNTFSGSANGARYYCDTNAVIYTAGAGANYLPGNTAGSTATGGQYV